MTKLFWRIAVLVALVVATGASALMGTPIAAQAQTYTPRFSTATCGFSIGSGLVAGRDVRCGYLTVPENRARPTHSIRLAVAIFKSADAHPAADPLIFLQGGPGGAIVADVGAAITAATRATIVGNRDLILVDQRGTGLSRPALSCPEAQTQQLALLNQDITPQQSAAYYEASMAQCHNRLVRSGIDLSAYTTYNNAADIHDLIVALGYPQVNVYGVSYGTRVALEIERSFPQHVRSVILDSTVPTQERLQTAVASARVRVFATLFAGCAASATCKKAYPNLSTTFAALVTRLNQHPLRIQSKDTDNGTTYTVLFKGADLYDFVWQVFYVSQFIKYIPDLIKQVNTGNTKLLSELFSILGFDSSTNLGVYYSVECAEGIPYTSPNAVAYADRVYPAAVRTANVVSDLADFAICRAWGVPAAPAWQLRPVYTTLPTLILEDQYDPITPPTNGALAAATIPSATQARFPGLGHGAYIFSGSDCPTTVVRSYLNVLWANRSCIASMQGPQFV